MTKTWYVFDRFGAFLGYVRADRKGHALFLAGKELGAGAGSYVGRVE